MVFQTDKPVEIEYCNYKGEISTRTIEPKKLVYSSNQYHPKPQWLLEAFCHKKQAIRNFAVKDIIRWNKFVGFKDNKYNYVIKPTDSRFNVNKKQRKYYTSMITKKELCDLCITLVRSSTEDVLAGRCTVVGPIILVSITKNGDNVSCFLCERQ